MEALALKLGLETLPQLEVYTLLPLARLKSLAKFPVVIDWLMTNWLLPAAALTRTQ